MHEYNVPETGAPVMSPGFLNWNMLAFNMARNWKAASARSTSSRPDCATKGVRPCNA
jgi:hypothetical protein